jgi:hypothetical protein
LYYERKNRNHPIGWFLFLAFSFEPDPATSADYSSSPPQAAYDGKFSAPREQTRRGTYTQRKMPKKQTPIPQGDKKLFPKRFLRSFSPKKRPLRRSALYARRRTDKFQFKIFPNQLFCVT